MKLVQGRSGGSFYESFSDLIFGTLVLFIVMVMALALKLEVAAEELNVDAEDLISANRFVGGADETLLYITGIPVDGETHLVWLPHHISDDWDLSAYPEDETHLDPVLDICRWYKETGVSLVAPGDLEALANGLSHQLVLGIWYWYPPGEALALIVEAQRLWPDEFERWTPEELKQALGERKVVERKYFRMNPDRPELARAKEEYERWSKLYDDNGLVYNRIGDLKPLLKDLTQKTAGQPPWIRVRPDLVEGRVWVGSHEMSAADFGNILLALKPGKGFYIDVVAEGGEEADPPAWFVEQVLQPFGFGNRVVRKDAD